MPNTYIVRCSDDTYHLGSTWDLHGRLWQHNHSDDGAVYTRRRRPVVLVWNAEFDSMEQAFAFEKRISGWRREEGGADPRRLRRTARAVTPQARAGRHRRWLRCEAGPSPGSTGFEARRWRSSHLSHRRSEDGARVHDPLGVEGVLDALVEGERVG